MPLQATTTRSKARSRLLLLPLSSVLYVLAFPGLTPGLGILSTLAFVPALFWLEKAGTLKALVAGFFYGTLSYVGITYWVASYHPAAIGVTAMLGAMWFTPLFPLLATVLKYKKPWFLALGPLLWTAADFGRASGFLAFPYGNLPYSLYRYDLALKLASVLGAEAVGFLIAFANFGLYAALRAFLQSQEAKSVSRSSGEQALAARAGQAAAEATQGTRNQARLAPASFMPGIAALALIAATLLGGSPRSAEALRVADEAKASGALRVALIQPGITKRQKTNEDYRATTSKLIELSQAALAQKPDLVIWHETSIIAPIDWHLRRRLDRDLADMLSGLQGFLDGYPVPILLGNGWADPDDPQRRVQGNAAILYEQGRANARYLKMALVPFSEYFPYRELLPGVADWLEERFGYFWIPGTERLQFHVGGFSFAAPICFEDSFGPHLAAFNEPDFFVILTDDSWARSAGMQEQHLSMSAFRAAETASIFLRAANTGATAAIEPSAHVKARLEPFLPGILTVDIAPVLARRTPYERWGRLFGPIVALGGLALGAALAAMGMAKRLRARRRRAVSH
ncbi:MAG TPA: apolipoprotein N-acyltransferase [Spirochaetaceae bacterium]|jgi:apolipoprotein N-acyltransferase|nr:apolipoprotein N-acyltransferase [Spirochaetaceae bacterium]